jgi:ribosome maturation factor RimP
MKNETQKQAITGFAEALLVTDPEYFLVDVKVSAANHIQLLVDGDQGISIEKCVSISRALYKQLEESDLFPDGNFSLEVSSPGLDEPIKLHRQYQKNIGRLIEVLLTDGSKKEGRLVEVDASQIVLEETVGRKKEVVRHQLLIENVKTAKIQVVFN